MAAASPPPSLERILVRRLIAVQIAVLVLLVALMVGTLAVTGQLVNLETEDETIEVVREAIDRDEAGRLVLRETPALASLRARAPDRWFVLRDRRGGRLVEGEPPPVMVRIGDALDEIGQARLGWTMGPGEPDGPPGRMKWIETRAGRVQVLTGPGPRVTLRKVVMATAMVVVVAVVPGLVPLVLAVLLVTPTVVRRSMASLGTAAAAARAVDLDHPDVRLSIERVPEEALPLVSAVNDALDRVGRQYAEQRRFLADAAHELRTPIAVLQTRLDALPDGPPKDQLVEDVSRLGNLAQQLLDIQRLSAGGFDPRPVDLVAIAESVVSDLAPLAIAAGYALAFEAEVPRLPFHGDRLAIERALGNVVHNAIRHGGRRGTITVAAERTGCISVTDEGDGIPPAVRDVVFEPFSRIARDGGGTGLGLHLVRGIVRRHGGEVSVDTAPGGGACFRLCFPVSASAAPTLAPAGTPSP
jgi:signal transduction histidine kinase